VSKDGKDGYASVNCLNACYGVYNIRKPPILLYGRFGAVEGFDEDLCPRPKDH
jgi:hypothetical protein